ncbi:hypothetical protein BC938DRAFT_482284 [Jimgerdemannia flammicorona]|uniref:Uncharacterized protein n=1 Tax=Jimgerdemannia flammicorona TaxID=994334 RepID=A0A433QEA9_9FUNG|nr:hypothetical protein BC938DRAFT_482284 [Jimgerdemannia flammicorona]
MWTLGIHDDVDDIRVTAATATWLSPSKAAQSGQPPVFLFPRKTPEENKMSLASMKTFPQKSSNPPAPSNPSSRPTTPTSTSSTRRPTLTASPSKQSITSTDSVHPPTPPHSNSTHLAQHVIDHANLRSGTPPPGESGHRVSITKKHPLYVETDAEAPVEMEEEEETPTEIQLQILISPISHYHSLVQVDPPPWSDKDMKYTPMDIHTYQLPDPTWEWVHAQWLIDMSGDVDEGMFAVSGGVERSAMDYDQVPKNRQSADMKPYLSNCSVLIPNACALHRRLGICLPLPRFHLACIYLNPPPSPTPFTGAYLALRSFVRRRRWIRLRRRKANAISTPSSSVPSSAGPSRSTSVSSKRINVVRLPPLVPMPVPIPPREYSPASSTTDLGAEIEVDVLSVLAERMAARRIDRERLEVVREWLAEEGGRGVKKIETRLAEFMKLFQYEESRKKFLLLLLEYPTDALPADTMPRASNDRSPSPTHSIMVNKVTETLGFFSDVQALVDEIKEGKRRRRKGKERAREVEREAEEVMEAQLGNGVEGWRRHVHWDGGDATESEESESDE